ncbi:MAG: hypothetical protein KGI38_06350 [Thaumarchaeota archaeon]|nr:hypothetical protein [Nitrososphaerota archaeon]
MNREVLGAIIVALMAAAAGVGFLAGGGATPGGTIASTTLSTRVTTATSTVTLWQTTTVTTTVESTVTLGNQSSPYPYSSVKIAGVPLGGDTVLADPGAAEVYVAADGSPTIDVVDSSTNTLAAAIHLPENSTGSIAAGDGMVFAPMYGPFYYIFTFNDTTNSGGHLIPAHVQYVAFDSVTGVLYGSYNDSIVGINPETNAILWNSSVGYSISDLAVSSAKGMVYALGCRNFFVCGAEISFVNATSGSVISQEETGSAYYPTMTVDPKTGIVYVSGEAEVISYGPYGYLIYKSNPLTCGPFIAMTYNTASHQLVMAPQNYDYLLFYDGTSLALVNMYFLPAPQSAPHAMAYDSANGEIYVLLPGQGLVALQGNEPNGRINSTLIAPAYNCLPV